jgi:hypothetical protein
LSVEFDSKAHALEAEANAAVLIGYGDDIGDLMPKDTGTEDGGAGR